MAAHVFYDPEVVASMRARGITARPRLLSAPSAASQPVGFVLARRGGPRAAGGSVVTHVVDVRSNVTITGRAVRPDDRSRLTTGEIAPQAALDLAEECTRLRRDNQRLVAEVDRLRGEVDRLTGNTRPARDGVDLDDSARRFALLELDL